MLLNIGSVDPLGVEVLPSGVHEWATPQFSVLIRDEQELCPSLEHPLTCAHIFSLSQIMTGYNEFLGERGLSL